MTLEPDDHHDGKMLQEVRRGLLRPQKELPSKYFYDSRGSRLFRKITRLPEYYLTRRETDLLREGAASWIRAHRPRTLTELGPGGPDKARILLAAMAEGEAAPTYLPVDVSREYLRDTARSLREAFPEIRVRPVRTDISTAFHLPDDLPEPHWIAFLGSTLGNFRKDGAVGLLRRVRDFLLDEDAFLLGVDLRPGPRKPLEVVEAAYNDARGVTAEFNRNLVTVVNRELGTGLDPGHFRHHAFYHREEHRIEMHLVAERAQTACLPDGTRIPVAAGESIRTELSHKYDEEALKDLLRRAGMSLRAWLPDEGEWFALALAGP